MSLKSMRYAIFFCDEHLGSAPTIINAAKVLAEQGNSVTIYTLKADAFAPPGALSDNIQIIYVFRWSGLVQWLKRPYLRTISELLELLLFTVHTLAHLGKQRLTQRAEAQINIGIDVFGLSVAWLAWLLLRQRYLFLSLELKPPRQMFNYFFPVLNGLVLQAYRRAAAVLVQDQDRFETLGQDFHFLHPQVFYLPNSPLAADDTEVAPPNFFREQLHLSSDFPVIALHAGMIKDVVLLDDLARAFAGINNGVALVIHSGIKVSAGDLQAESFIASLQRLNSSNLFLSLNPVPYDQIDRIYSAATIGLVFYKNLDSTDLEVMNYAQIANASGKLTHFLKYGKPVLVSNQPSLIALINRYPCGIVIDDPASSEEMGRAIEKIMQDYPTYSRCAKDCFTAEFDFRGKMQPMLHFIDQLVG